MYILYICRGLELGSFLRLTTKIVLFSNNFKRATVNLIFNTAFLTAGLKTGYIMKAQYCMLLGNKSNNYTMVHVPKWVCRTKKVFHTVA